MTNRLQKEAGKITVFFSILFTGVSLLFLGGGVLSVRSNSLSARFIYSLPLDS